MRSFAATILTVLPAPRALRALRAATVVTVTSLCAVTAVSVAGCNRPAPVAPTTATTAAVDMHGTWKNERGSELRIDQIAGDAFTGRFRSGVGHGDPQQWFPATGFVHGDVVGFAVDFTTAGSVASWAGQVMDDKLVTQWHLSRDVPDAQEHDQIWSTIMSGQDTFTRE